MTAVSNDASPALTPEIVGRLSVVTVVPGHMLQPERSFLAVELEPSNVRRVTHHGPPDRFPPCCRLEHSETVEDYLKTIHNLACREEPTTTSQIARRLAVSAPSVSTMVSRLTAAGLAARSEGRQVVLTEHGLRHARSVVRRHRLLETLLYEVLGVPWDELHAEAEVLEHGISGRLADRIADRLGHPDRDPHGDPIPPREGGYRDEWPGPLRAAPSGANFLVERVSDQDSAALRHLGEIGIRPGTRLVVQEWSPFGGPLWVSIAGSRAALGEALTHLVRGVVEEQCP